jgi:hypothetical protein
MDDLRLIAAWIAEGGHGLAGEAHREETCRCGQQGLWARGRPVLTGCQIGHDDGSLRLLKQGSGRARPAPACPGRFGSSHLMMARICGLLRGPERRIFRW